MLRVAWILVLALVVSFTALEPASFAEVSNSDAPSHSMQVFATSAGLDTWIMNPNNGHEYKLISCNPWNDCQNKALSENAHLVTIGDLSEQTWLAQTFGQNERYWIGFTDEAAEGQWQWVTREPVTFTNWANGEPNDVGSCEDYAVMNWSSTGEWNDIGPCSAEWWMVTPQGVIEREGTNMSEPDIIYSSLRIAAGYSFSIAQGAQVASSVQLTNAGTEARTALLEVLNPYKNLVVSLSQQGAITVAPGETKDIPIAVTADSTTGVGTYDGMLLKVSTDDGKTVYSSLKVYVTAKGAEQLPDLTIRSKDIKFTDNTDGTVTLTAVINNQGASAAAGVGLRFYDFGTKIGSAVITQVPAKSFGTAFVTVPMAGSGDHLISVMVDPSGMVQELDETNNQASQIVPVGTTDPTEGNILVTGSLPTTIEAGSLFTVVGKAMYAININGATNTNYVVKGGAVKIKVVLGDGMEVLYGDMHTDVTGRFSRSLSAPLTPGTYHIVMTVTDQTFSGTRDLVFKVVPTTNHYSVTFNAGSEGTLTGATSQTVDYGGSTTEVTAIPAPGYQFLNWTDANHNVIGSANPITLSNVTADAAVTANFLTISAAPDLTVTVTHKGIFRQGQVGATYTITVTNSGSVATTGMVTVADSLPGGLTATAMKGAGWYCTLDNLRCTRSKSLAAGSSFPPIILTVKVANDAPPSLTNTVTVSGGGEVNISNDVATDTASILPAVPDLTITKSHKGKFKQGQLAATYSITVTNSGTAASTGMVTVADELPDGLTATSIGGSGWLCTLAPLVCSRSDMLLPRSNYPAITLTVDVAANAPASVTNTAKVSGGGEANLSNDNATDPTTIIRRSPTRRR